MKTMERIILNCLRSLVVSELDPLQFAYQSSIGVDDAVIYLLHRSYLHLEDAGRAVRIMFFNLSSAFNTIYIVAWGEAIASWSWLSSGCIKVWILRGWQLISIWLFTLIINWTGPTILRLCIGRGKLVFICCGDWGLWECRLLLKSFMTL